MCLLVLLGEKNVSLARPWLVLHEVSIIFDSPCFRSFETKYAGVDMLLNVWCSAVSPSGFLEIHDSYHYPPGNGYKFDVLTSWAALQLLLAYSLSTDWRTLLMPCYKFHVFLWNGHNLCTASWQYLLALLAFADCRWLKAIRPGFDPSSCEPRKTNWGPISLDLYPFCSPMASCL